VKQDKNGKTLNLRSQLEKNFTETLEEFNYSYEYEVTKLPYIIPESKHVYTVDFTLPNGILIEGKGWLKDYDERQKYILIKQQYPNIDLRFVFGNPNKFCGGMKKKHWQWAEEQGFKWCGITDIDTILSWASEKKE
jgi:hypothetical protein